MRALPSVMTGGWRGSNNVREDGTDRPCEETMSHTRTDEVLVNCRNVWKVFDRKAPAAITAIQEQALSKQEVLQQYDCVVGVADANLQIYRGEIFCVMGLSGSGKSTLIRLLNRLISPSLGDVLVKDRNLAELNAAELRTMRAHHIGMVFQSVALLPQRTVLENTAFGLEVQGVPRDKRNEVARQALDKVGLADWLQRYPSELSGGMQQRVGLARAIAADPEIILMDEPFSALDPLLRRQLQDEFWQLIRELGKSAVFITHDLDEAIRLGDRIAIMKDGAIIQEGRAEEIVQAPADDYVADFVAGISTLNFIKAAGVMNSVAAYRAAHPEVDIDALHTVAPDADLEQLIDVTEQSTHDALAVVDGGAVIGIVTPRHLLAGIRGTPQSESRVA